MDSRRLAERAAVGLLMLVSVPGCENGNKKEQGAVIGDASAGTPAGNHEPLLGGLTGGAATGGYLVGANWEKITGNDLHSAQQAVQKAQSHPATAQEARITTTADINNDGFVTTDEVLAMKQAGFSEDEMIRRLQLTGQVFDLSAQNERDFRNHGISQRVIESMKSMNRQRPATGEVGEQSYEH
jgi:hypothetical protein